MIDFEQLLWLIAIPASVLFILQTIATLLGLSGGHTDVDISGDHSGGIDSGFFPIFTLRNLIVFLLMFGWTGIALVKTQLVGVTLTLVISFFVGLLFVFLVSLMFWGISKLTSNGSLKVDKNIIGSVAKVYLKIPANKTGAGKIVVFIKNRSIEMQAVTEGPEIYTGAFVKIVDLKEDGLVFVLKEL